MSEALQAALDAQSGGISVWPPCQDGTKRPDGAWKIGQTQRSSQDQILSWYKTGRTGVGWITGKVSGNLEVIDFDDRATWVEYQKLARESGLGVLLDRMISGYLEHTPNGAHLPYFCDVIDGNKKLAQRASDHKSLIETRGEGGFVIVAPSHGSVNLKGSYVLESGNVKTIPKITPEERQALFDIAKIFDETKPITVEPPKSKLGDFRPGDDFNGRATWDEVLEPHGWRKVSSRLGVVSWCRPGKKFGVSATTNHANSDLLYVFSSSTNFEANRGYSKFSAHTILNHGGDFHASASDLAMRGYGIETPTQDVDLSFFMFDAAKAKPASIDDLLRVPGLVGDLAQWINDIAHKPQPVLALGASIAAMGTILGRKVRTETDLRSNIYVLGVGETGCGKERARQAINKLFAEIGAIKKLGDSFASDSAVERAVMISPTCLYLIDEIGHFLGTVKDQSTPAYVRSITTILLRLYSSSESIYRRKLYASQDPKNTEAMEVSQPCLSVYGTTVPGNLYGSLTRQQLSDGFLSRLLVFESKDPDPEIKWIDAEKTRVPQNLINGFLHWEQAPTNCDPLAGNIEMATTPSPLVVKATSQAKDVYADLEATMRLRRKQEREGGGDQGPFTRVTATAQKLALIRACGIRLDQPEITEDDARWGADLAWSLTESFLAKVSEKIAENKTESDAKRLLDVIKQAGRISRSELTRRTQFFSVSVRKDLLTSLLESGLVSIDEEQTLTNKRVVYKAN